MHAAAASFGAADGLAGRRSRPGDAVLAAEGAQIAQRRAGPQKRVVGPGDRLRVAHDLTRAVDAVGESVRPAEGRDQGGVARGGRFTERLEVRVAVVVDRSGDLAGRVDPCGRAAEAAAGRARLVQRQQLHLPVRPVAGVVAATPLEDGQRDLAERVEAGRVDARLGRDRRHGVYRPGRGGSSGRRGARDPDYQQPDQQRPRCPQPCTTHSDPLSAGWHGRAYRRTGRCTRRR
jgi:hypothetical protein